MKRLIAAAVLAASGLALAACDVEQTEEGDMPEVEGGNMPEYDVDAPDVDADVGTTEVDVPDKVTVPTLDVDVNEAEEGEANADAQQ